MNKQTKRVFGYAIRYANEHGESFERAPLSTLVNFVSDLRHLVDWVGADWDKIVAESNNPSWQQGVDELESDLWLSPR